jgi:hypothetical protein
MFRRRPYVRGQLAGDNLVESPQAQGETGARWNWSPDVVVGLGLVLGQFGVDVEQTTSPVGDPNYGHGLDHGRAAGPGLGM